MNKNVGNHGGVIRGAVTQLGTKKMPLKDKNCP